MPFSRGWEVLYMSIGWDSVCVCVYEKAIALVVLSTGHSI